MANEEQLAILKQGVDVWNQWREENPNLAIDLTETDFHENDLSGINLSKANLDQADFVAADLSDANLCGVDLSGASLFFTDFQRANLSGANLEFAEIRNANLHMANLSKAYLKFADLRGANLVKSNLTESLIEDTNFVDAKLSGTDFSYGTLDYVIFGNNDLSCSVGLETIRHTASSTLDTDTIQKSKGKIPVEFLRGCGLSDLDIAYAKLAAPGLDHEQVAQITYELHNIYIDQPIQFYSCFISYNNKDEVFAQRLHDDLQNSGVRCWFAPEDMKIGDRIRPTIDNQIRMREKLIVILSENSIQSEWVGDEVEAAFEQEKESGKDVLFPISLDDAIMNTRDDWAAKIKRRRSIGDFSKWKDDTEYQKIFQKLLKDLRASEE